MKLKHINILAYFTFCMLFIACGNDQPAEETAPAEIVQTGNPAIDKLTAKIAETPNDGALFAARAGVWLQHEGFDEAIEDLQQAISLDSLKPEYHHVLADIYMDYYKSRLALKTMETAGSIFPKRIPTLLKLAEIQWILKQFEAAQFTLERIRVIDPYNSEMFFMLGNVHRDQEEIPLAKENYQSAVENDPDLIDAWINLAKILASEDNPLAGRYFENALRVDSNNVVALHAMAYYQGNTLNNLPEAIRYYKKINVVDPQYEDGYYNLGLLYLDSDSIDAAHKSFDLAIKINPTFVQSYFYRGIASKFRGDIESAKADFQQALNLSPEYERAQEELEQLQ